MIKTVVVLLNWNGLQDTLECLESLGRVKGVRVLVVDNGSTDNSVAELKKHVRDLLVLDTNQGFAGGCNAGIQKALAMGADRIMLLSNDTVVAPDMIDHLHQTLEDPTIGIAGPVSYEYPPPSDPSRPSDARVWASGARLNRWLGLTSHIHSVPDRIVDREYMPGVCWMMRSDMIEKAGMLPLGYEAYFEDVEYCLRIRQKGWRVVCAPRAALYHKVSRSMGGRASPRVKFLSSRNRIAFLRRIRPRRFSFVLFMVSLMYSAEFTMRFLRGDLSRADAVIRGYRDAMKILNGTSS